MADLYERWIAYYQVSLYLKQRSNIPLAPKDVFQTLKNKIADIPTPYHEPQPPEKTRFLTTLKDIDFNVIPGKVVLLFASLDKNREQLLGHEETFVLRAAERRPGEHGASTAHVVIDLTPAQDGSYGTVVEQAEGLPASRISSSLNWLLRKFCRYSLKHIAGKVFQPTFRLSKRADVDVAADLSQGELVMLALSRRPTEDELAASPAAPPREILVKISLPSSIRGAGAIASVRRLAGTTLAQSYPILHVGYKDRNGKNRTAVEELTPEQDALANLIHRKEKLPHFGAPLPAEATSVIPQLARAMAQALDSPT